jgi:sugar-specific transcriptional regulator TrmB
MNINQALEQLGLTANEAKVYLYLVESRFASGNQIHQELDMDKSSFYRAIKILSEKGLVRSEGVVRNQTFFPAKASFLKEIITEQRRKLNSANQSLKSFIKEVENYSQRNYLNSNIKIYTGDDAYYQFMEQVLQSKAELFRDLTSNKNFLHQSAGSQKKYQKYMQSFIPRRVEKGMKIRLLMDNTVERDDHDYTNPATLKEVRIFPHKLDLNCFLHTFGDTFGFMTQKANNFWGILVKDKMITSLLNSMYDQLWNIASEDLGKIKPKQKNNSVKLKKEAS